MDQYKLFNIIFCLIILTGGQNLAQGPGKIQNAEFNSESDIATFDWHLWGYRPHSWRMNFDFSQLSGTWAEYSEIPITIPGSVQYALRNQNIVPDWNIGLNYTQLEWIENRHWIIASRLPDELIENNERLILLCKGLDYQGTLYVNGKEAGFFNNAFIPWSFDIGPFLQTKNNTLAFVFECPPGYLGQIGYTSKITDWKPRFYYGWDWVPRIVQTGVWDEVQLLTQSEHILSQLQVSTSAAKDREEGDLNLIIENALSTEVAFATVSLKSTDNKLILKDTVPIEELATVKSWKNLPVERWFPNGWGKQPLYLLELAFFEKDSRVIFKKDSKIGFKHVEWLPCLGAPENADPWICSVNNRPLFIQGINWTPLRPNFADLTRADYEKTLGIYKKLGINTIRIWGGGFAEKSWLYEICDEMGIMIWQDFPLSSSGLDNYPPTGKEEITEFSKIVHHYVNRLKGHVSLLLWCGGNELYEKGDTRPVDNSHPLIAAAENIVFQNDTSHRFVPGSPSGPSIYASPENFGKGMHWDTHGPWKLPFGKEKTMNEVHTFWKNNDSFFFSEVGVPGAMSASMIKKYSGEYPPLPASLDNPLWRTVNWWNEWEEYVRVHSKSDTSLEHYVSWSQNRQTEGLETALKQSKEKFPACGGFLIWMGHDCFPCMINTSIIDFEGNLKPAAERLSKIWLNNDQIIYSQQ